MAQYSFGTGSIWISQTIDAQGNTVAVPLPVKVGELQDVGIDFSRDVKLLHGQLQFPVAMGGGKAKIDIKAKFARINGLLFNNMYFGQGFTSGTLSAVVDGTASAAIPATPFQITVTPPNSGTFGSDLGVVDASGNPYTRVASAPATGQYSVSGAVYTFAAADTSKVVYISYRYTSASTTAKSGTISNLAMGFVPTFGLDLAVSFGGKPMTWRFPNCTASKLGLAPKQDDFTVTDVDIAVAADATGIVATYTTAE